jgi:hypothetical protein
MIKLDYQILPKYHHPHKTVSGKGLHGKEVLKWRRLLGHEKSKFPETIENAQVTFIRKTRQRTADKFLGPSFSPLLEGLMFNKIISENAKIEYKWQREMQNNGSIEIIVEGA